MFAVAGIDPFRTVTAPEITVEAKPALAFQHRHALRFGAAGINGRFMVLCSGKKSGAFPLPAPKPVLS